MKINTRFIGSLVLNQTIRFRFSKIPVIQSEQEANKIAIQQKIESEETDFQTAKEKFLVPLKRETQIYKEEGEVYVADYTRSPTKTVVKEDMDQFTAVLDVPNAIEWKKNSDQQLDVRGNPLALKVMSEGVIDFTDDRIQVRQTSLNLNTIDLGRVEVLPNRAIHLSDVDVNNIPDDLDIQLDKEYRELTVVGMKNDDGSDKPTIKKQIIEDIPLQQFKDAHLVGFEQPYLVLDKVEFMRKFVRKLPLYLLFYTFVNTAVQYYYLTWEQSRIEDQEWKPHQDYLEARRNHLQIHDQQFARARFM